MAYIDRKNGAHRTATVIAVAAIEAAAIYGVIQGLDVVFTPREAEHRTEAINIKLDPPKPLPKPSPLPSHSAIPRDPMIDAVKPVTDFQPVRGPVFVAPDPIPLPSPSPTFIAIADPPNPAPRFTPRAASPRNNPASWATPNDYPSRDLREGNQGLTRFRLSVSAEGKVLDCTIVGTSGFPGLDRAACDNIARRAKFDPATDASGEKVAGSYSNTIRWVIPD